MAYLENLFQRVYDFQFGWPEELVSNPITYQINVQSDYGDYG